MRVVYSYWASPNTQDHAGYTNRDMLRYGWTLSVMMADEFYDAVLWTDKEGWDIIEPLELPWKEVHVVDFSKYGVPRHMWNLSKVISLSKEDPPFVQIDHDVFLHKPLPDFEEMLFQNWEHFYNYNFYDQMITYAQEREEFHPLPRAWDKDVKTCLNCGVIGCKNKEFIDLWFSGVLEWLSSERFEVLTSSEHLSGEHHLWPAVIEQFLAACADKKMGNISDLLFDQFDPNPDEKTQDRGYTHLLAGGKRNPKNEKRMINYLRANYPERYKHVKKVNHDWFL